MSAPALRNKSRTAKATDRLRGHHRRLRLTSGGRPGNIGSACSSIGAARDLPCADPLGGDRRCRRGRGGGAQETIARGGSGVPVCLELFRGGVWPVVGSAGGLRCW